MNTVLQLEKMPDKSIDLEENKKKDIKDYDKLIPVITLIWLADDDLNFTDDFVSFTMTSETGHDFLRNKNLWREENLISCKRTNRSMLSNLTSSGTKSLANTCYGSNWLTRQEII